MTEYGSTDYLPSLEAGALLLSASTAINFVQYERYGDKSLRYFLYLPPGYHLQPVGELLGEAYPLLDFEQMASDLSRATGLDCEPFVLRLWTFAYYTGWAGFSSDDVYLATDGEHYHIPPLLNYTGAFLSECDYESIKPPRRMFQCYWHNIDHQLEHFSKQLPYVQTAVSHFKQYRFYM